jgi:hypothetical protein
VYDEVKRIHVPADCDSAVRVCRSGRYGADIAFRNTSNIYGAAQFLMVSGRAGRKGSRGTAIVKFIYCARASILLLPLVLQREKEKNKGFAQFHVGNTVTSTSFIPILAFTTTDAFLANINWRYTTVLHAL